MCHHSNLHDLCELKNMIKNYQAKPNYKKKIIIKIRIPPQSNMSQIYKFHSQKCQLVNNITRKKQSFNENNLQTTNKLPSIT